MSNAIHHRLAQLADMAGCNHDGLHTLAALLACAADHPSQLQRPEVFAGGLSGLVSAIACREQEIIEGISTLTRDMSEQSAPEATPTPSLTRHRQEMERHVSAVLDEHGLTLDDLRNLKTGRVVLTPSDADDQQDGVAVEDAAEKRTQEGPLTRGAGAFEAAQALAHSIMPRA